MVRPATAPPGSEQVLQFVVGHGCSGQPTTALKVILPDGVKVVEAIPKPGWTFNLVQASPGSASAAQWSGGVLASAQPDGFQLRVRLPAKPITISFQAYQSCGDTVVGWVEAATQGADKPKHPAPMLTLTDAPEAAPAAMPGMAMH